MRFVIDKIVILLISTGLVLSVVASAGCGPRHYVPSPPIPDDRRHVPVKPKEREYNITADLFDKQVTLQIEQSFDLARQFRNLLGKPKQAYNVDAFDEVASSSWFTNRNATQRMTLKEIARGSDHGNGPDNKGKWLVTRAKAEGVTPGFTIKDKKGDHYLIKFDPPGFCELVTGAEVVSTKLFYAAGYNVPENYITYFHPEILELKAGVKFTDSRGRRRLMTDADLAELLDGVEKLPDGRIRALASKYLPGHPLGPFSYASRREDDPNDIVPHHHRRELRGLKVMAAWLNHVDTKSGNSLDIYFTDGGRSYVKHYLIDFGSTLGSAAHGPMAPKTGHENQIDPNEIFLNMATLGLRVRSYEKLKTFEYPSIGLYESGLFNPGGFKFNVPNPAFDNCTGRDGYWGAKLVMSFTDEQLRAAVEQGRYSDAGAFSYLLRILKERRDKTGRYWFNQVNPLDNFTVVFDHDKKYRLRFADLAVDYGLESSGSTRYRYELKINGIATGPTADIGNNTYVDLEGDKITRAADSPASAGSPEPQQWEIKIETFRESTGKWSRWVKVHIGFDPAAGEPVILGIERQD